MLQDRHAPKEGPGETNQEKWHVPRSNERRKELKRRRHRKKKMHILRRKLESANTSTRAGIVEKIRSLTPGAEHILANLGLDET